MEISGLRRGTGTTDWRIQTAGILIFYQFLAELGLIICVSRPKCQHCVDAMSHTTRDTLLSQTSVQSRQEAASPACHPSRRRMHSSAACFGQAHSPTAGATHSSVGTLQWATACPALKNVGLPSRILTHLYVVTWSHWSQPPNDISISSAVFVHLSHGQTDTHTHTHRRRYVRHLM